MERDDGPGSAPDAAGRALWRRLKNTSAAPVPVGAEPPVGALDLAAWLDGKLPASEAARVERYLASHPAALDAALDASLALSEATAAAPERLSTRAQALVGFAVEGRAGGRGWFRWIGSWRRSVEFAAVAIGFVGVSGTGYALGGGLHETYAAEARRDAVALELVTNPLAAFDTGELWAEIQLDRGGRR